MEAVIVALRPKQHATVTQDFRPRAFDILLIDLPINNSDKTTKQLPKATLSYEEEPAEPLFNFLYQITGAEYGGLKGKRAVFVPPSSGETLTDLQDSFTTGTLYCIPIESREKLNPKYAEGVPLMPGFYSLDKVLDALHAAPHAYSKQTQIMLHRLNSWLQEKYKVPGAVDLLFSISTEYRLKFSVTNPAYFAATGQPMMLGLGQMGDQYSRSIANEALAKMMAIEKCDLTIINPLYGSGLPYKNRVDAFSINKLWGLGKPDYSRISVASHIKNGMPVSENWTEQYPMHKYAFEGDAKGIRDLIAKGRSVTERDKDSWAPIHYAAWHGHLETITILLNEGECSPNITNDNGSTPLHFAAVNGHPYVTELLLNHPDIDVNALDKYSKSALTLCENVEEADRKAVAQLLKRAMNRPSPKIQVFLMDGTYRPLSLVSGANTTVQQLHSQMMKELNMPDSCHNLFTVWICSKSLQLQLKPDHKPIQHLNDWRRKIVGMLTDRDPIKEEPQLFWRRDAILCISDERKLTQVENAVAINLLFHEAFHNYIKSLYPCADHDAVILGSILMQLNQGDYEPRKVKTYFANDGSLHQLIPDAKVRNKSINWASRIQNQYQQYTKSISTRDRSPQYLQLHFLTLCWNLTVYGSAFFTGYVQIKSSKSPTSVYVGVNDVGIHIIHGSNKTLLQSFKYADIEWQHKQEKPILEIRLKGNPNCKGGGMCVMTRQAGLINHLMTKLSQITS